MSEYMDTLAAEQLKHMDGAIDAFLVKYKNSGIARGVDQKTVLFFPGGLGSELSRADQQFDPDNTNYTYNQFWYDLADIQVFKAALWLQMRRQNNVDYDDGNQFILASGEFNNCLYAPYAGFVHWCGINNLDLLVCGWDNRRNADCHASFFRDLFPAYVRKRAREQHGIDTGANDPLGNVYLVGHSEGGNLIKWILNAHEHEFCKKVQLAVTVATAFYGNVSQCHRMFEGESLVGAMYGKAEIAKAVATMPGGYALFFLDGETYDRHRAEFEADVYPLVGYPSIDSADGSRVDPYRHPRGGNQVRYHEFGWDLTPYIDGGLEQFKATVQDLHPSMKGLFHNIRGVQIQGGEDYPGTPGLLTWRWIDRSFDPDRDPSPIVDGPNVPGDGVVPAWSARLLPVREGHVHTLWGEKRYFGHMEMMEADHVLAKLWELLQTGRPRVESQLIMARRQIVPAPVMEVHRALLEIKQIVERVDKKVAPDAIRAYVDKIRPKRRMALIKRWFMEMAKGPRTDFAKLADLSRPKAPKEPKLASPEKTDPEKKPAAPKKPAGPKGRRSSGH